MQFNAKLSELDAMMSYFRSQISASGSEPQKAELALEEVLVNIIYHSGSAHVHIDCSQDDHQIMLTVKDTGEPFNPLEERGRPDIEAAIEDRDAGGLGIYFIKKLVDDITYQRVGNENVLSICKRLSAA